MWAHTLIDKLANIVNYCDLLNEGAAVGSRDAQRVAAIRNIARGVIKDAIEHQRELSEHSSTDAGRDKVA